MNTGETPRRLTFSPRLGDARQLRQKSTMYGGAALLHQRAIVPLRGLNGGNPRKGGSAVQAWIVMSTKDQENKDALEEPTEVSGEVLDAESTLIEVTEEREVGDDEPPSGKQLPAIREERGLRKKDLLGQYLAEVRRHPLLSAEEEREVAILYRETGDSDAAQRLVTANLRLVVKLAFQYHRQWSNVLDLIQEGNVGLVEALKRYDPYREIRFSSYAQYWIRAMILRFLMDNFRMVRLGTTRHGRKLFFQLKKERDRLLEAGYQASTKQLAENLQVPESEVILMDQHLRAPALSLDAPVGADGEGGASLSEFVPVEGAVPVDEQVVERDLGMRVRGHLDAFAETLTDERDQLIWTERLLSKDPASLSALGSRFGVSKERVRQLEARIRKNLKAWLLKNMGDEIDFDFVPPEDE